LDDLAQFLGEMEGSALSDTVQRLPADQFNKAIRVFENELARRAPVDLGNMNEAEFATYKRLHGL